ncbi:MAG TPA: hypothetical protein VE053_00135 [Allosphingosinicella sp.]|nr:hypothetical protein [Allosphingosinicella sp.]
MTRALIFLVSVLATVACKTPYKQLSRGPESFKIDYRYEDSPVQRRILLFFHNTSNKPVCFGAENWPQKGILLNTGDEVFLEIGGERHFLAAEQDYCPFCNIKVLPGAEVQGYLEYKSFGLSTQIEFNEKKLVYSPVGFSCR